jgi:hypothetical protein
MTTSGRERKEQEGKGRGGKEDEIRTSPSNEREQE